MALTPDPEAEPWSRLPDQVRTALWRAGYTDPEYLASIPGRELRSIPGIGRAGYDAVREVWPVPPPTNPYGTELAQGNPGNRGNPNGRPTTLARARSTEGFLELIDMLVDVGHDRMGEPCEHCGRGGDVVDVDQRMRAADLLGKYGPGTRREVEKALDFDTAKEFVRALAAGLEKHVFDEDVLDAVAEEWKTAFTAFFAR